MSIRFLNEFHGSRCIWTPGSRARSNWSHYHQEGKILPRYINQVIALHKDSILRPVIIIILKDNDFDRAKQLLYSWALKITIYFACAVGGPARTVPKGHVPLEPRFPPAGGIWYGCRRCCAVPAPPERRRGGWLSSAELFGREYS